MFEEYIPLVFVACEESTTKGGKQPIPRNINSAHVSSGQGSLIIKHGLATFHLKMRGIIYDKEAVDTPSVKFISGD